MHSEAVAIATKGRWANSEKWQRYITMSPTPLGRYDSDDVNDCKMHCVANSKTTR